MDLGGDGGADTGLHIVAGQRQLRVASSSTPSSAGMELLAATARDTVLTACWSSVFSQEFQHLYLVPFSYFAGILFTDKS